MPAGNPALAFFPYGFTQAPVAVEFMSTLEASSMCFPACSTIVLLPYGATPLSAWSPSQQVLPGSSNKCSGRAFCVQLHGQVSVAIKYLGAFWLRVLN